MTSPARARLAQLRSQRGQHLAAIVRCGGALREYHKQEAAKLSMEIERLEEEIRREEARQ